MNTQLITSPLHKVLVVDDDPIILRTVYFALRDKGCSVLTCGDVTGAMRHIREERPELIVLDIHFPPEGGVDGERDGFWALNWMRQLKESQDTPVIMISIEIPKSPGHAPLPPGPPRSFKNRSTRMNSPRSPLN